MADTAARFRALAEDAVNDLLRLEPETATDLGDHRYDDQLTDLSDSGLARAAATFADHRDELDSLDVDDLEPADAVDAEILRAGLDRRVFAMEQLREHTWNPLLWLPGDALYLLLSRDTLPVQDRLAALGGRLRAVPERLAVARDTLANMPRVHVETALTQISGLITMLREEIPRWPAPRRARSCRVEPMRTAAEDALVGHRTGCWSTSSARRATPASAPSCTRRSCISPSTPTSPPSRSPRPPGSTWTGSPRS